MFYSPTTIVPVAKLTTLIFSQLAHFAIIISFLMTNLMLDKSAHVSTNDVISIFFACAFVGLSDLRQPQQKD